MGSALAGPRGEEGFDGSLQLLRGDAPADLRRIAQLFCTAPLPWTLLQRYVRFDAAGYARQSIVRGEAFELLLLCWLPGQATPVHGHDGSAGLVRVVTGSLEESLFESLDAEAPTRTHTAHAGDLLVETPETIHRVVNAGTRPALSLHLYAPPLPART